MEIFADRMAIHCKACACLPACLPACSRLIAGTRFRIPLLCLLYAVQIVTSVSSWSLSQSSPTVCVWLTVWSMNINSEAPYARYGLSRCRKYWNFLCKSPLNVGRIFTPNFQSNGNNWRIQTYVIPGLMVRHMRLNDIRSASGLLVLNTSSCTIRVSFLSIHEESWRSTIKLESFISWLCIELAMRLSCILYWNWKACFMQYYLQVLYHNYNKRF
jgi:hypothetical protein